MQKRGSGGLRALLRGLSAWAIAALLCLLLASLVLAKLSVGSAVLGPVSSAVSFLAAFAAGRAAAGKGRRAPVSAALLLALFLVILLLSLGALLRRGLLDPSGVLSVVSFTFAGVLAGSLLRFSSRSTHPSRPRPLRPSHRPSPRP